MALAMAASARFFCAAGASASTRAASRASRPISRIMASRFAPSVPWPSTALSGAFMALIRLAFANFYHVRHSPARRLARQRPSTAIHSIRGPVTEFRGTLRMWTALRVRMSQHREGVMHLPAERQPSRLPKRFPVGTTYVVEGRGGEDGAFARVFTLCGPARRPAHQSRRRFQRAGLQPRARGRSARPQRKSGAKSAGTPLRRVEKNFAERRNQPPTSPLIVRRRAKPPSPSPSITRRRTPAALAAGVHLFFLGLSSRGYFHRSLAIADGSALQLGNPPRTGPLRARWRLQTAWRRLGPGASWADRPGPHLAIGIQ